jgi:molybdate transport system substrate-binding protein
MAILQVMSGGAPKDVFNLLVPQFERASGHQVRFTYAVIAALRDKIAAGETADVLVLPVPVLQGYAKEGKAAAPATFGIVATSIIVRDGAAAPDVSTKEKFRAAMLAAGSVVHATPGATPSGTHMGKVMTDLGIADVMAKKTIHKPALDGGVELVATGQADIGIYPASEVAHVKGVRSIGSLPSGIDFTIVYGGAVTIGAAPGAAEFVRFMAAPEHRAVWAQNGFTPGI